MNRIYFSLLVAALCGCGAEEPAAEVDPVNDAQPVSDTDADPDGAVRVPDGGLADVGSDTAADAAPPVDAAPDLGPMDPLTCPQVPSPRADDALRVDGCRFRVDGPGTMLPRAVVVSADSLGRELGTPFHESTHYVELASIGRVRKRGL